MEQSSVIFFIGPQGSGKGTQAKILAERLHFFHWDNGKILREIAASGSELGNKVKELIDKGVYLSDDFLFQVVKAKLDTLPKEQGIIFDGLPRRFTQAQFLLDYLKQQGRKHVVTLFIDIPREETMKRLIKRAEIEKRIDDTPEKIDFRLKQYEKETLPMLDFLKTNTEFLSVDGRPAIEEVATSINAALKI